MGEKAGSQLRFVSSRTGISDGSELDAVERCCTRRRLLSRVGDGMYVMEVTAVRAWGDLGPYRSPGTRGEVAVEELDLVRDSVLFRRSIEGWRTESVGGFVANGAGAVSACLGAGRSGCVEERMLSLWERPVVGRWRAGVDGSFRSSNPAEMGSSCSSSPLKSVIMLFQSEPSDSRVDRLVRGSGVLDDAAAMTRLRSTSLTLMLLRLLRFGTMVADLMVSWVTVPVGDGVRARVLSTTMEWSSISISVSESASSTSGCICGSGFWRSNEDDGLVKASLADSGWSGVGNGGTGGTGGTGRGNALYTEGAEWEDALFKVTVF